MPGPFKEGPVEISFEPSNGKQKMTVVIDFGKATIEPTPAAQLVSDIVRLLRRQLDVELSAFKD